MTTRTITRIACDECKRDFDARGLTGWYRVERHPLAVDTRTLSEPDRDRNDWDLCSAQCLANWATKRP